MFRRHAILAALMLTVASIGLAVASTHSANAALGCEDSSRQLFCDPRGSFHISPQGFAGQFADLDKTTISITGGGLTGTTLKKSSTQTAQGRDDYIGDMVFSDQAISEGWKVEGSCPIVLQVVTSSSYAEGLYLNIQCSQNKAKVRYKGSEVDINSIDFSPDFTVKESGAQTTIVQLECPSGSRQEGNRCVDFTARNAKVHELLSTSIPDEVRQRAYQSFRNSCRESLTACPSYETFVADDFSGALYQCAKEAVDAGMVGETSYRKLAQCLRSKYGLSSEDGTLITRALRDKNINLADVIKTVDENSIKTAQPENSENKEETSSCALEGVGWLLCPVVKFVANVNDAAFGQIKKFLSIRPTILNTNSGTYTAWEYFRNIANAIFVVVFLWVIFSQLTSVGVSNYGIKKILPRLIIGAILINLSFVICQLAVDASNVLGNALAGLMSSAGNSIMSVNGSPSGLTFAELFVTVLAVATVAIFAYLVIGIPVLAASLISLAMVFVILIARQAAVILLIALSPVAFAAWLIPNTEGLFKKWLSVFKALLLLFPIVSLLYGAGTLASAVLSAAATVGSGDPDIGMQIASLGVLAIPLAATPAVLKSSLNSLGAIGAKIGSLSGMANQKLKGAVMDKSRLAEMRNKMKMDSARRQAERRSGNGFMAKQGRRLQGSGNVLMRGLGKVMSVPSDVRRGIDNSAIGRAMGFDRGAGAAKSQLNALFEEEVKNAAQELSGTTADQAVQIVTSGRNLNGGQASDALIAAAMDKVGTVGGFGERNKVLSAVAQNENMSASMKERFIRHTYAKGDSDAYGVGFGDSILSGKIRGEQDLKDAAVRNAAAGNLQPEQLVKSASLTEYIFKSINGSSLAEKADAEKNAREAAREARSNDVLKSRISGKVDAIFRSNGV